MAARNDEYVVTAPYVLVKVRNAEGSGFIVREFFEGSAIHGEDVDPDNLAHHVENRLLAPKGSADAEFAAPSGTPKPGEPPNVPVEEGSPPSALPTAERLDRQQAAVPKPAPKPPAKSTPAKA